ncbi:AAA family ATPase [Sphingobacterium spiritivorum]|uniref:AAA family ATPase n=1 Tax=Sphingobacterium spiritivorum TaxID=258 RepID=UPI001919987B|nr:AAA family ATPase [Sphingobacterium spiritivorum]QQT25471.1 AAA family ATPase [Sphingobacterium spiritivorum]
MNTFERNNFYIITGGPGVGKTTLIETLKNDVRIVAEVARQIIKEQIQCKGLALPWAEYQAYAKLMFDYSVRDFLHFNSQYYNQITLFDRGIPDTLCYLEMLGDAIPIQMENAAKHYRYNRNVFILPPWKDIFEQDDERKQSWDEAEQTYYYMKQTYEKYGYHLIDVPKVSLDERRTFILEHLQLV